MEELIDAGEITSTKGRSWKWIRIVERIFLGILAIGIVFKLMHLKGGGIMPFVGFSGLSFLYTTLFLFLINAKKSKGKIIALVIVSGVVLGMTTFSLMLKSMLWTGGDVMVFIGYLTALLGFSFLLIQRNGAILKSSAIKASTRLLVFGFFAIAFSFISPRTQFQYYMSDQASESLLNAFEDSYNNPNDKDKLELYDDLRKEHYDSINQQFYKTYTPPEQ